MEFVRRRKASVQCEGGSQPKLWDNMQAGLGERRVPLRACNLKPGGPADFPPCLLGLVVSLLMCLPYKRPVLKCVTTQAVRARLAELDASTCMALAKYILQKGQCWRSKHVSVCMLMCALHGSWQF